MDVDYLIVFYSTCLAHIVSNATKKSVGVHFGIYMHMSHCLDGSVFDSYDSWVRDLASYKFARNDDDSAKMADLRLGFSHRVPAYPILWKKLRDAKTPLNN